MRQAFVFEEVPDCLRPQPALGISDWNLNLG